VSPQARLGENLLKRLTPSHNQEDPKPNSLWGTLLHLLTSGLQSEPPSSLWAAFQPPWSTSKALDQMKIKLFAASKVYVWRGWGAVTIPTFPMDPTFLTQRMKNSPF
jgi:hypothetical protein